MKNTWGQAKEQYTNFELLEEYFITKNIARRKDMLTERSMEDLEFPNFFRFIDRTNSAIGQQYLYNQLRFYKNCLLEMIIIFLF